MQNRPDAGTRPTRDVSGSWGLQALLGVESEAMNNTVPFRSAIAILSAGVLLAVAACGSGSPSAPLVSGPAPVAILTFNVFGVTALSTSAANIYSVNLQLREIGGTTGATVNSILFSLQGLADTTTYTPSITLRVPPNTVLGLPQVSITDSTKLMGVSQMSAVVRYTDDGGHQGVASGSASVPEPRSGVF